MNYKVFMNHNEINVYQGNIFPRPYNQKSIMEYASFILNEEASICICAEIEVKSVVIRPLSLNMKAEIWDNKIWINVKEPANFSVEINGSTDNNILMIANPVREYTFDDSHLIYFEKGIHRPGILTIHQDNTIVYLEEGAYVHGKIHAENMNNLKILGTGIISMEEIPWEVPLSGRRCVDVLYCKNVEISDIIIHDSVDWSLRISGCDTCRISNVKIIGARGNSDGIDICGSRDVVVRDCFLRVWDDALVIKALDTGDVKDVLFENCTVWNDFARPIEVGVELRADTVKNITFTNIDVIHSTTGYPVMGIHHGDRALVSDITFSHIRIEDAPGAQLFDIRITDSVWNRDKKKGNIRNIHFSDIDVLGDSEFVSAKSRIQGFTDAHDIKGITFHNIRFMGQTATNLESLDLLLQDHVSDVVVTYDEGADTLTPVYTQLEIVEPFLLQAHGLYKGKVKITAENKSKIPVSSGFKLHISPVHTAVYEHNATLFTIQPGEKIEKVYDVTMPPGKYCAFVNSNKPNLISSWLFLDFDLVLYENLPIAEAPVYTFHNYYGVTVPGIKLSVSENHLQILTTFDKYDTITLTVYTAVPVPEQEDEVKFSVEETDFGEAMAILKGKNGLELAPQLRCPAEITYVFKNEPKVEEIVVNEFSEKGLISIPFSKLGLKNGTKNFWLEIALSIPAVSGNRYPFTLFHSVAPKTMAHMFVNTKIKQ